MIQVLEKQRQTDVCKFEASLISIVNWVVYGHDHWPYVAGY